MVKINNNKTNSTESIELRVDNDIAAILIPNKFCGRFDPSNHMLQNSNTPIVILNLNFAWKQREQNSLHVQISVKHQLCTLANRPAGRIRRALCARPHETMNIAFHCVGFESEMTHKFLLKRNHTIRPMQ